MVIFLFWIGFAIAVGVLANRYGRDGAGWFFLSLLISPLLGGIILLALGPRPLNIRITESGTAVPLPNPGNRTGEAFRCDGVYDGMPYHVTPENEIDVLTAHGIVRFRSMDDFRASVAQLPKSERADAASTASPAALNGGTPPPLRYLDDQLDAFWREGLRSGVGSEKAFQASPHYA